MTASSTLHIVQDLGGDQHKRRMLDEEGKHWLGKYTLGLLNYTTR